MMAAAAARWSVPITALAVDAGVVRGPGGRSATYGELAEESALVSIDGIAVTPKAPADYKLIGQPTRRVDSRDIVTGAKKFSMDHMPTTAKPAMLRRSPTVKGAVKSINNAAAVKAMPGVRRSWPSRPASRSWPTRSSRPGRASTPSTSPSGRGRSTRRATSRSSRALRQRLKPFDPAPAGARGGRSGVRLRPRRPCLHGGRVRGGRRPARRRGDLGGVPGADPGPAGHRPRRSGCPWTRSRPTSPPGAGSAAGCSSMPRWRRRRSPGRRDAGAAHVVPHRRHPPRPQPARPRSTASGPRSSARWPPSSSGCRRWPPTSARASARS